MTHPPHVPPPPLPGSPTTSTSVDNPSLSGFKIAFMCISGGLSLLIWLPGVLFSLYLFGGINFPEGALNDYYRSIGWLLLYGSGLFMVAAIIALAVRKNLSWPALLVGFASAPLLWTVYFVLYMILGDKYGYVCC